MIAPSSSKLFALGVLLALAAGCVSNPSIKPAEALDERTGMTVGSLEKPIEMVQGAASYPSGDRRPSFAYLGPIEWDNMGTISYGLWIHLAPGNDWRFDDMKQPGGVILSLDDVPVALSLMDPPKLAHGPYQPAASWGQTAYFNLDLDLIKRMASTERIGLDFKAGDTVVRFSAPPNAHALLLQYLHARGY
jgi:hypothetical protein